MLAVLASLTITATSPASCACQAPGDYCNFAGSAYPFGGTCHAAPNARCSCLDCASTDPTKCASPPPSAGGRSAPLGHRAYTYQKQPFVNGIASFNAHLKGAVKVVNAYGGWFTTKLVNAKVSCLSAPPPAAPGGTIQALPVTNNAEISIQVLTCAFDGCKGSDPTMSNKSYTKCSRTLPGHGANSTLVLDPALHFLLFIFNETYSQECWPKTYGVWPAHLTLPLNDAKLECALPTPSVPIPIPTTDILALDVEPGASTHGTFANVSAWSEAEGIDAITINFDGRMDLCTEYADYNITKAGCGDVPDVSKINDVGLAHAADRIASIVCSYALAGGAQIDLEPFGGIYKPGIVKLMGMIAAALRNESTVDHGCVDAAHPEGRSVSLFTFAESIAGTNLLSTMGANAMVVLSGYDLYPDSNDTKFNTPQEYKVKLAKQINAWLALPDATKAETQWTLGIPMTASAHEYEQYVPDPTREHCGPACTPWTNTATQDEYVTAAFDVIDAMGTAAGGVFEMSPMSRFRGISLWLWSGPNTTAGQYPPNSGNYWLPINPSDATLNVLHDRFALWQ